MPARVNKIRHDENTRLKIQASNIVNRLQAFFFGHKDPRTDEVVKLDSTQVAVGLALLKKILPDMSLVEHTGEISTTYVVQSDLPIKNIDEWAKNNIPRLQ